MGIKERRAGSFTLGGGSKACPDLFEGSFLDLFSIFYCFFIGLHGLSAEGRFGIGAFCFKTKDTSHSRGYERATNHKKAHAAQALNSFSFEGQKKQKPIFSSKAAGANQPHTKTKSARAEFY